jgi:hypothetical protein
LTEAFALRVLRGAALPESEFAAVLETNPRQLLALAQERNA